MHILYIYIIIHYDLIQQSTIIRIRYSKRIILHANKEFSRKQNLRCSHYKYRLLQHLHLKWGEDWKHKASTSQNTSPFVSSLVSRYHWLSSNKTNQVNAYSINFLFFDIKEYSWAYIYWLDKRDSQYIMVLLCLFFFRTASDLNTDQFQILFPKISQVRWMVRHNLVFAKSYKLSF